MTLDRRKQRTSSVRQRHLHKERAMNDCLVVEDVENVDTLHQAGGTEPDASAERFAPRHQLLETTRGRSAAMPAIGHVMRDMPDQCRLPLRGVSYTGRLIGGRVVPYIDRGASSRRRHAHGPTCRCLEPVAAQGADRWR